VGLGWSFCRAVAVLCAGGHRVVLATKANSGWIHRLQSSLHILLTD
jgi:hypothetical protein